MELKIIDDIVWCYHPNGSRGQAYSYICTDCTKTFYVSVPVKKSRRCKPCANKGKNNPAWKANILKRSGNARALRLFMLGSKCELCDNFPDVRHHIDQNTLNNSLDNIKMLCHTCHNRIHAKVRDAFGRFQKT